MNDIRKIKEFYGVNSDTRLMYVLENKGIKSDTSCVLSVKNPTKSVNGTKIINVVKATNDKNRNNSFNLVIFGRKKDAVKLANDICQLHIEQIKKAAEREMSKWKKRIEKLK